MGIPVSIKAEGSETNRNLTACFFLPEKVQADPPKPTNPEVFLEQRPTLTIITKYVFGRRGGLGVWVRGNVSMC